MEKLEILEKLRLVLEAGLILIILILAIKLIYKNYKTKSVLSENERLHKTLRFLDSLSQESTGTSCVSVLEEASISDLRNFKYNLVFFYKRKFYGETINIKALGKYLFFIEYDVSSQEKRDIVIESIKLAALKSPPENVVNHLIENIKAKATNSCYDDFDKKSKFFILSSIAGSKNKKLFLDLFKEKMSAVLDDNFITDAQKFIISTEMLMVTNYLK